MAESLSLSSLDSADPDELVDSFLIIPEKITEICKKKQETSTTVYENLVKK